MTSRQIFEQFPDANECWKAGTSEYFLKENDAKAYCDHFNVAKVRVLRSEIFPDEVDEENDEQENESKPKNKPTKAKLKAPKGAGADATDEAKEEAEVAEVEAEVTEEEENK